MKRTQIINELKRFFAYKELVCPHVLARFGSEAWFIIPTFWLETILVIRTEILKRPMICNNYSSPNGVYTQRGTRCNLCQIVKEETMNGLCYQSAHFNNVGNDFTVVGLNAEQARKEIIAKKHLLPYPIRLESGVNWLHVDGYDYDNGNKINFFTEPYK